LLHTWLQQTLARVSKKSELAQAIGYVLGRWTALARYCSDGRIEIHNNAAERALRMVALGRKNFLFTGSRSVPALRVRAHRRSSELGN